MDFAKWTRKFNKMDFVNEWVSQQAMKFLTKEIPIFDYRVVHTTLGLDGEISDTQDGCEALMFLYAWVAQNNAANSGRQSIQVLLGMYSSLDEAVTEIINNAYNEAEKEPNMIESPNHFLDLEWALGNTIATENSRKLGTSFVKLQFEVVNKGEIGTKTLLLTLDQFKELHGEVKRMQGIVKSL